MREKQPRLVVTFHTTAGAIATEQLCRREQLEGKLVSVPRSITSDCGTPGPLRRSCAALWKPLAGGRDRTGRFPHLPALIPGSAEETVCKGVFS